MASIEASEIKSKFVINVMVPGMIKLVGYSDIKNLKETMIEFARFLHDVG